MFRKDIRGIHDNGVEVVSYIGSSKWQVVYACGHIGEVQAYVIRNKTGLCNSCSKSLVCKQRNTKHSMVRTPTYNSWLAMRRRCLSEDNNRYQHYGARGITVCDRWLHSFENFLEDMGEKPEGCSLDRLNLDEGYCKDNCRWSDSIIQANNKSNVKLITDGIESWSLRRWCERLGLDYKHCWYLVNTRNMGISDVLGVGYKYVV